MGFLCVFLQHDVPSWFDGAEGSRLCRVLVDAVFVSTVKRACVIAAWLACNNT